MHRDIKSENILIQLDKINSPKVKIIDFGFACDFKSINLERWKIVGTIYFISPEGLQNNIVDEFIDRRDIWSTGITIHELIFRSLPIPNDIYDNDVLDFITNKMIINVHQNDLINEVLRKCLIFTPSLRPSANDLIEMIEKAE